MIRGARSAGETSLISWAIDKTVRLWDYRSGVCKRTFDVNGIADDVEALSEDLLLVTFHDGQADLWSSTAGRPIVSLVGSRGHRGRVVGARLLEDQMLLTWSVDETFRLWDTRSGECLSCIPILEAFRVHLDWARILQGPTGPGFQMKSNLVSTATHEGACLQGLNVETDSKAKWQSVPRIMCYLLCNDGTIVVGDLNGRVSFLKPHIGYSRVNACDLRRNLGLRSREKPTPNES